jgi:hypothetical protein
MLVNIVVFILKAIAFILETYFISLNEKILLPKASLITLFLIFFSFSLIA